MTEINDNMEQFDDEDTENYITLTDDDGKDVSFEIIGTVEYKERLYAILLPFDEDDDGIVILEIVSGDDPDYDDFVSVDDQALLEEIYEEFKKNYQGEYEFE